MVSIDHESFIPRSYEKWGAISRRTEEQRGTARVHRVQFASKTSSSTNSITNDVWSMFEIVRLKVEKKERKREREREREKMMLEETISIGSFGSYLWIVDVIVHTFIHFIDGSKVVGSLSWLRQTEQIAVYLSRFICKLVLINRLHEEIKRTKY